MPNALIIRDEAAHGVRQHEYTLEVASSHLSVRELIFARVRQEVAKYNARTTEVYYGLVQPTDSEAVLNGYRLRKPRQLDADEQCARALEAFDRNGFFVLVNDRQVESLDEALELPDHSTVTFVKLVPLVGG